MECPQAQTISPPPQDFNLLWRLLQIFLQSKYIKTGSRELDSLSWYLQLISHGCSIFISFAENFKIILVSREFWCMQCLLLLLSHFSHVRLCATPSLGFSRQKHWSGLPFPFPMRESEVAQSCSTLCDPMDCSLPGSSIHGIFQARVLEWGAIARILQMIHKYLLNK